MIYQIKFSNGLPSFLAASDDEYATDTEVIVKSDRATFFGKIGRRLADDYPLDSKNDKNKDNSVNETNPKVLRPADDDDRILCENIRQESAFAKEEVLEIVTESHLDMKVATVAYNFDQSYLFISFVAENRVDFRQLLKELASHFQIRIELRQIGSRDKAQIFGGVGPCGRPLCCAEFLYEFPTVSIKMAKNQQLAFNQGKLNGMCGRLMCCLSYEDAFYKQASKDFPDFGEFIETDEGRGKVIGMNILSRTVKLRFDDFVREYTLDELVNQKVDNVKNEERVHGR